MTILLFSLLSFITGAVAPGEPQRAELLFVGDAMQHQAQLDRARELGGDCYDYSDCFTYIAPEITAADYAVCNLEVPLRRCVLQRLSLLLGSGLLCTGTQRRRFRHVSDSKQPLP